MGSCDGRQNMATTYTRSSCFSMSILPTSSGTADLESSKDGVAGEGGNVGSLGGVVSRICLAVVLFYGARPEVLYSF
jgi:hypothetical protein